MACGGALPPWDKNNPLQQTAIKRAKEGNEKHIHDRLTQKRPELLDIISPSELFPYLRSLRVIDSDKQEKIELLATTIEKVDRLLDYIERGPTWRFHGLLRACLLTNQQHVIIELGFDPQVYEAGEQPSLHHPQAYEAGEQPPHHEPLGRNKYKLSSDVRRAIEDHAWACKKKMMKRSLFGFDNDPSAKIKDVSKCFIQVQTWTPNSQSHISKKTVAIPEEMLLRCFNGDDSPQSTRLDGPPGAGKTTFLRHLVHQWSEDFLKLGGDPVILDKESGPFSLMVYLHTRSIKSSLQEAIRKSLWCKPEDKDILMNHVKSGEGVAILVDAIDEIRNEVVMEELECFVKEQQTAHNQKVLLSSRKDLCKIPDALFDRITFLEGFTIEEALDYVKCYFPVPPPPAQPHPVLQYIEEHEEQLQAVLSNPLRLHIFCELTSRGLLELDASETFDVIKLFRPLEKFMVKRERERCAERIEVAANESENFSSMCFYGLMNDIREFTEELLTKFNVSQVYQNAFLNPAPNDLNIEGEIENNLMFQHEMLYDFFSSCYLETVSDETLKSLPLTICSRRDLRNVQKIVFEILAKRRNRSGVLQTMIRGILILQNEKEAPGSKTLRHWFSFSYRKKLQSLSRVLGSEISIEKIQSHANLDEWKKVEKIWKTIDKAFESKAHDLRTVAWFRDVEDDGTLNHITDCLRVCSPTDQQQLIKQTVHRLLPCHYTDVNGASVWVYAAGPTRWGQVEKAPGGLLYVMAWSPEDVVEVLQAHSRHHPDVTTIYLGIFMNVHNHLWGVPREANCWSQQTWTSLLQAVPDMWKYQKQGRRKEPYTLWIVVPDEVSLTGLLVCPPPESLSGGVFTLWDGTADLQLVETWADMCEAAGVRGRLDETTIMVPQGGEADSLKDTVDRFKEHVELNDVKLVDQQGKVIDTVKPR